MCNKALKCMVCVLSVGLLLISAGCASREQTVEKPTDPPAQPVTKPANQETAPTDNLQAESAPALREIGENEIPILFTVETSDTTCDAYRIMWNLDTGTLSEKEFCYSMECESYDDFWDFVPEHWTGGSVFSGLADKEVVECASGVCYQLQEGDRISINYGKCCYRSGSDVMQMENDDGSVTDIRLPADVPAEIYDSDKLTGSPYYATVDSDTAIVVYMRYQFSEGEDSDFVYCTYPVAQPEAAQWQVVAIPAAYWPDVILTKWRGAYSDGCLYFGTGSGFVSLNLAAGELTEIADVEYIRSLSPEGSTVNPYWGAEYPSVLASHNGIIVGHFYMYEPDGSYRDFCYAMKNNQVIEIAEITENIFTFYDEKLNVISVDDTYADIAFVCRKWAKDD